MTSPPHDLAPHVSTLVIIIGVLWAATVALVVFIWQSFTKQQENNWAKFENQLTRIVEAHHLCQSTLAEKYVDIETFRLWQNGREKLWDGIGRIEGKIDNLTEKILVNLLKIAEGKK